MADLRSLTQSIDEVLSRKGTKCLWFSGGSDSRLLLEVMLKAGKPFGILTFRDGWTREQKKVVDQVIIDKNLEALTYPPLTSVLTAENDELSLVSGYAIGDGQVMPIIRDLVHNDARCLVEDVRIELPKMLAAPVEFDTHIFGTRKDDKHWLFGDRDLSNGAEFSRWTKTFVNPLWNWTKDEVTECLRSDFGLEPTETDTGNIEACSLCLTETRPFCPKVQKEIEPYAWQPAENLQIARRWLIGE